MAFGVSGLADDVLGRARDRDIPSIKTISERAAEETLPSTFIGGVDEPSTTSFTAAPADIDVLGRFDDYLRSAGQSREQNPADTTTTSEGKKSFDELFGPAPKQKSFDDLFGKVRISETDYVLNSVKKGLIDLLAFPGLAVDAATEVVNLATELFRDDIPEITNPALGSRQIRELLERDSFTKDYEAPTETAKWLGSVAEYAAPSLITGPIIAQLQNLSKLEKARVIATELAINASSGLGAEAGEQYGPELLGVTPEQGRMLGGLVTPFVTAPATATIPEAWSRIKGLKSEEYQKQIGRVKAGAVIREHLGAPAPTLAELEKISTKTKADQAAQWADSRWGEAPSTREADELAKAAPEYLKSLEQVKGLQENIPGWSESVGRSTGSPGILALERGLAEKNMDYLQSAIEADRAAAAKLNAKMARDFPDIGPDITRSVGKTYKKVSDKLKVELHQLQKQVETAAEQFVRYPTPEIGARLRDLKENLQDVARVKKTSLYNKLYATADNLRLKDDVTDIYDLVKNSEAQNPALFQGDSAPKVFKKILDKWAPKTATVIGKEGMQKTSVVPTEVSFAELHSMMKDVNATYRKVKRQGTDPEMERNLSLLMEATNKHVSAFENSEKYGVVAKELKEANAFYSGEYQSVFKEGAGARISKYNVYGDITPDAKIVKDVFLRDSKGIDDFFKIYGENDEAYQLLKDGTLDIYAKMVLPKGEFSEAGMRNFKETYKNVLPRIPEINKLATDTGYAIKAISERQLAVRNKIDLLNGSLVKKLAGTTNLDTLLDSVIKEPKKMMVLTQAVSKEKHGLEALAHTMAVRIAKEKDPYRYIQDNIETLGPLLNRLGPNHAKNLITIAEATSVHKRSTVPTTINISTAPVDTVKSTVGTTMASILSQARAVAQNRVSAQYVMSDIGGKYLYQVRQKEMERVLNVALYDPKFALEIMEWSKAPKITPGLVAKVKYHLLTAGALATSRYEGDMLDLQEEP